MPVRNEEAFIARSLGAVLNQTYPAELMEIMVADGESDDRTREIIASLPGAERVQLIVNARLNQAAGLNEAIRQARGEIIVRVDGHTIIAPDYLHYCVATLRETGAENVGGPMRPVGVTLMGKAIAWATQSPFAVPSAFHVSQKGQYTDTVYMGAWPRQVLERVGRFDERLCPNEDYELNYRIRKSGGTIYLTPTIRSEYIGRQTLLALIRQYFQYGKAKTITIRKYPASLRLRQIVAPGFVGALLGGLLLSAFIPLFGYLWLLLPLTYLATTLVFAFPLALQGENKLFWRVTVVFMAIHISWGIGFWVGLLRGPEHKHQQDRGSHCSVSNPL
jgi:glycosyltransferase involved in cell wall biosynthesis